jgi:hypothetical protein
MCLFQPIGLALAVLVEEERLTVAGSGWPGKRPASPSSRDRPLVLLVEPRPSERRHSGLVGDSDRLEHFQELRRPREASARAFRSDTAVTAAVGSSSWGQSASRQNADRHSYSRKSFGPASSCQTYHSYLTCQIRNRSIRCPSYLNHSSHRTPIPLPIDHPLDKCQPAAPRHRPETVVRPDCSGSDLDDSDAADGDCVCPQNKDCHSSATWSMHNP